MTFAVRLNITGPGDMKACNNTLLVAIMALVCSGVAHAETETNAPVREGPRALVPGEVGVGRLIADLELTPVTAKAFRLSSLKSVRALVIALTSTSCPVTK